MTNLGRLSVYYFCVICVLFASCTRKATKITENPTNSTNPATETNVNSTATPKNNSNENTNKAYVVFSLEKGSCYGKCPTFEAQLMSDGKAIFKGLNNVELLGTYTSKVSKDKMDALIKNLNQAEYFKFADYYPLNRNHTIPDLPNTTTSYNDGKQLKKITNNTDSPANLQWFETELENFFMQLDWKKEEN